MAGCPLLHFLAIEGYLNSCCIITVICMTVVLVVFLLSVIIYIGWWREDLWHEKLTKYNYNQVDKFIINLAIIQSIQTLKRQRREKLT